MGQGTGITKMAELYRGQRSWGEEAQRWAGESSVEGKLCLLEGGTPVTERDGGMLGEPEG